MTQFAFQTGIGSVSVKINDGKLEELVFKKESRTVRHKSQKSEARIVEKVRKQLLEYAGGRRRSFELPLLLRGTEFQKQVWQALLKIPFGETVSYGDLAKLIGRPKAARAVGRAVGQNPCCVVVPCHRVIAGNGRLGGFSGGLAAKKKLLAIEGLSFRE